MELVYLWIEKYKNIEKQGFNFSPKYRCEFKAKYKENGELDEKNSELIIEENKGYVNLFPENINITAIVGKNGAGKSSVLELIVAAFYENENNFEEIKNFFLVFQKNDDFIIYYLYGDENINNLKIESNYKYSFKTNADENIKKTYFLLFDFSLPDFKIHNDKNSYKENYSLEPSSIKAIVNRGKIYPSSFYYNLKINLIYFYWYIYKNNLTYLFEEFNIPFFEKFICLKKGPAKLSPNVKTSIY